MQLNKKKGHHEHINRSNGNTICNSRRQHIRKSVNENRQMENGSLDFATHEGKHKKISLLQHLMRMSLVQHDNVI